MAGAKYNLNDPRADVVAALGEFIGTFLFLFFGLGGIQAARDASASDLDASFLLMASTAMGFSLVLAVFVFFRVTGAAFNPNISFALLLLGVISPLRFVLYVFAQLLGAITACGALYGLLPGPLLLETQRAETVSVTQALFIEMFLTFGLTMTVIMTLVEKNKTTVLAPLAIGIALFATQMAGIQYTGAAVNTARAFGPSVVNGHFIGSHWIFWLGPTMGSTLAALLYKGLLWVHYWELNPGADATNSDEAEGQSNNPSRNHNDHDGQPGAGTSGRKNASKKTKGGPGSKKDGTPQASQNDAMHPSNGHTAV